jgi:O-antigen/teichoic acid export membrane protein
MTQELMPAEISETAPAQADEPIPTGVRTAGFARKIAAILATKVTILGISLLTSVLLSKLLTPDQRGAYVAVTTMPGMISTLALFGLPQAINYFAGRGSSIAGLIRASALFTVVLSSVLLVVVWFSLPALESSLLQAAGKYDDLARVILVTLPAGMLAAFGGTMLYGRQEVRVYNAILVFQAATSLAGAVILVGVLRMGVHGAVAINIFISLASAVAVVIATVRLGRRDRRGTPAPIRALIGYGARLYPASVTGYFNYRADSYIIQALAISATAAGSALGLYSLAVTMAEVVFMVPESVSTMFLPRVAGSTHEDASAALGRVARLTLLVSILVAVALIPVAYVGVHLVLPLYVDCLPAFIAILPGVITLSLGKVMTSYLGGRGKPGTLSIGATVALLVNVPMNIILIPRLGIVGASLSSVASYTVMAAMMVVVASRVSGQSPWSLCIPRRSDFGLLAAGLARMANQLRSRITSRAVKPTG